MGTSWYISNSEQQLSQNFGHSKSSWKSSGITRLGAWIYLPGIVSGPMYMSMYHCAFLVGFCNHIPLTR